jgi:ankyrin repeat protein
MQTDMDFARREMGVACEQGNVKRVKQLVDFGVDVSKEQDHRSYLHRAATFGQYMVIKVLLRAGAVPSRQDLVAAVQSGSRHSADYLVDGLLDSGQDPADFSWNLSLQERSFMEALTPEMAKWLVAQGIDVNETDNYGRSIVELAEKNGSEEVHAIFAQAR